jgi:hypothetical protein
MLLIGRSRRNDDCSGLPIVRTSTRRAQPAGKLPPSHSREPMAGTIPLAGPGSSEMGAHPTLAPPAPLNDSMNKT